ncbi:hypothetical protein FHG87_002801 [Trinorchestia longiramus]|nr:hypothetical protein FHG87_002801 [Trinorchestia longiramus]
MSTCCGACQKQVGCAIIGSLTVLSCGVMVVQSVINLAAFDKDGSQFVIGMERPPELFLKLEISCLVLSLLGIVAGIIFIYGVLKDRINFMVPFIIWSIITMIFAILDSVHIFQHFNKNYAVLVVLAFPVGCYFVWVAWSHMLERKTWRKEEAAMQQILNFTRTSKERR